MGLRFYSAVVAGALAEILTLAALWTRTEMELGGMIFWSIIAYFAGMAAALYITEPPKRKRTRYEVQIYDLKEDSHEQKVS